MSGVAFCEVGLVVVSLLSGFFIIIFYLYFKELKRFII